MFPSAPPPKHHVQFALKLSVRFTPPRNCQVQFTFKSPSPIYPQIVCTIYPPSRNRQVRITLKSPTAIYPQIVCMIYPPQNHQVWFTLKSPTAIYPQIICTIYPPPPWTPLKSPSPIYPQISNCDLPSNHLYDLPPPWNCQVQFTLKSPTAIYPQIVCTIYPPSPLNPPWNCQVRFTLKSPTAIYPQTSVWFTPQIGLDDLRGVNRTDDLRVNRTWQF